MKVYIANGFAGRERANQFAKICPGIVVSSWHRNDEKHSPWMTDRCCRDHAQIYMSDVVVVFNDRSLGGGRHTELGMAIAWKKHVLCIGTTKNVFENLVECFDSEELCLRELSRLDSLII